MTRPPLGVLALLAVTLMLRGGPAPRPLAPPGAAAVCRPSAQSMARLELLSGTLRKNAAAISEDDWASFPAVEVTPRFPGGLTVPSGYRQWRSEGGAIAQQRSIMLVIWSPPAADSQAHIEAIRAAYKSRVGQHRVLRFDGVSCVSF